MKTLEQIKLDVKAHMMLVHQKKLEDLKFATKAGFWTDGIKLYGYIDRQERDSNGRFLPKTRSWKMLKDDYEKTS